MSTPRVGSLVALTLVACAAPGEPASLVPARGPAKVVAAGPSSAPSGEASTKGIARVNGVEPLVEIRRRAASCANVAALPEPRALEPLVGRCVVLVGYWAPEVAFVPTTSRGVEGYRKYRPFRFVTERNPSLGWPEWYALAGVLVDEGFVEEPKREEPPSENDYAQVATVVGVVRRWPQGARVWEGLHGAGRDGPYARTELGLVVSDIAAGE